MPENRFDSICKWSSLLDKYGRGAQLLPLTGDPGASYLQLEEVAAPPGMKCRITLPEQRGTGAFTPSRINVILD